MVRVMPTLAFVVSSVWILADPDSGLIKAIKDGNVVVIQQPGRSTEKPTADCVHLRMLSRLARLGSLAAKHAEIIAQQEMISCTARTEEKSFRWSSGSTAKSADGSWDYPSGLTAKYADGRWNFPSGRTAKSKDGSWSYPSGATAKRSTGQWQRPSGASVAEAELLTWACGVIGHESCKPRLTEIGEASGDERDLAILDLAWTAQQATKKK